MRTNPAARNLRPKYIPSAIRIVSRIGSSEAESCDAIKDRNCCRSLSAGVFKTMTAFLGIDKPSSGCIGFEDSQDYLFFDTSKPFSPI